MNNNNIIPFIATHPGEVLADELKARKIKQSDFAKNTGIALTIINEIIKGKRSITADIALILEKVLEIEAQYWLNLQSNYELDKARIKQKNIQKLSEIINIQPTTVHKISHLETKKYFGTSILIEK